MAQSWLSRPVSSKKHLPVTWVSETGGLVPVRIVTGPVVGIRVAALLDDTLDHRPAAAPRRIIIISGRAQLRADVVTMR